MKRKYLVLASCIISALLIMFPLRLHADENVTADAGASSNSAPLLDSYFWDNYYLLPYIETTHSSQYIDTGVYLDQDMIVDLKISYNSSQNGYRQIFGSGTNNSQNRFFLMCNLVGGNLYFNFANSQYTYVSPLMYYSIYDIEFGKNVYINGELLHTFDSEFTTDYTCYIFARNTGSPDAALTDYKLYMFSIYDTALSDPFDETSDPVGYVRYYYPAKAKSSGVIGLYDAVSKTFVTSGGSTPFVSPTDDKVIHFQIGDFIESGLGWIEDILEFAIDEPMILMFMAIGLCGVAFRWARRVVHF